MKTLDKRFNMSPVKDERIKWLNTGAADRTKTASNLQASFVTMKLKPVEFAHKTRGLLPGFVSKIKMSR